MAEHDFVKFPELTNSQMPIFYFDSPHQQIFDGFIAEVTKVSDGDTIRVSTDFRDFDFPIRLANIQAPELNEDGGKESGDFLRDKILGEEIYVGVNRNNRVGKFGRLIGEIFHGGLNLNQELLREGLAQPFGLNADPLPDLSRIGGRI